MEIRSWLAASRPNAASTARADRAPTAGWRGGQSGGGQYGALAAPIWPGGPARARRAPGRPHPAHPMHPGRPRRGRFALRTYTQQRRAPPWSPHIPAAAAQLRWPPRTLRGRRAPCDTTPRTIRGGRAPCDTTPRRSRGRRAPCELRDVHARCATSPPSSPQVNDVAPEHTDVHHLPPPTSTTTPAPPPAHVAAAGDTGWVIELAELPATGGKLIPDTCRDAHLLLAGSWRDDERESDP
jgi:hypothetical protein